MSTLRSTLDQLLELQRLDLDRDRTLRAQRNLDSGQAAVAAATEAQGALAAVRLEYQKASASLKDSELELAALEKKLKSYEDRVRSGAIVNSKELVNTEKEIGQLVRLRSSLDEKILALMDSTEELRVRVSEADARATEADRSRTIAMDKNAAERSRLDGLMAELGRKREEQAGLIEDRDLLKRYEAIRARNNSGGIAIGRTQDNTCGSCRMQVASIEATRARAGETLVLCENCGRIMA
ncbi:MAG: C4-type zinc ribbon domain-containing protein [Capsulimonadaceae bacterium]|nr:C4-type zinc ribbon domain-containing protein [Capsulimonadaceae bacterium]